MNICFSTDWTWLKNKEEQKKRHEWRKMKKKKNMNEEHKIAVK